MRFSSLLLVAGLALPLAHPAAQSPKTETLTGTLTVKTRGATTAVLGKAADAKQGDFMFCIDQNRSSPQAVDFSGPGRVVYQPMPKPPMLEGAAISGPEMETSSLAVVAADGRTWLFVGSGEKPVLAAGDPALAKARTVNIQMLRRTDWAGRSGPRRGVDLEGCLAPGG